MISSVYKILIKTNTDKYAGRCCIYSILSIFVLLSVLVTAIYYYKDSIYKRLILGKSEEHVLSSPQPKSTLKIAIASDIESDYDTFDKYLSDLSDMSVDAVFIIGDITTLGVLDDMNKIKTISEKYDIQIDYIPGDRDLWKNDLNNFKEVFQDPYYDKELSGFKFLFINNSDEYNGIDSAQFEFIEKNLESADFVLLHNPIYFEGSLFSSLLHKGMGQYSSEVDEQRIRLLDLIRKSEVKAVVAGDLHLFTEQPDKTDDNLNHYTIGALNNARSIDSASYAILEVFEDGSYSVSKQYIND